MNRKIDYKDIMGLTTKEAKRFAHKWNGDPACNQCNGEGEITDAEAINNIIGSGYEGDCQGISYRKICSLCHGEGYLYKG